MWVRVKIVHLVNVSSYWSRRVLRLVAGVRTGRWIHFAVSHLAFLRCWASWVERLNFCCWLHPTCSHLLWESWERTKDLPGMWALFMWQDRWEQNFILKCDLVILILHASSEKLYRGSVIKMRASKQRVCTHFFTHVVEWTSIGHCLITRWFKCFHSSLFPTNWNIPSQRRREAYGTLELGQLPRLSRSHLKVLEAINSCRGREKRLFNETACMLGRELQCCSSGCLSGRVACCWRSYQNQPSPCN